MNITILGHSFTPSTMSVSDFLDYWIKNYCEINLKYNTIQAYKSIIKNHIKNRIGMYRLSQITPSTLNELMTNIYVEKGFSKAFLKNILKVLKGAFGYATNVVEFINKNPAQKLGLPSKDIPHSDPVHIFSQEEIEMLLDRFKNNHCFYYAILTAYYTGLRVSEVFGLTWEDIDFENKTISVNKIVVKKNQKGYSKGKHLSGKAKTIWYFGACKTKGSYRTVTVGDTLINALKEYKIEQDRHKLEYGYTYMKHYKKIVNNPYNNQPETKILNALAEIDVALPEVNFVFLKDNGIFEGTDTCKYPFKVIHYELGIPCRFHDFRDTHATRLIEARC